MAAEKSWRDDLGTGDNNAVSRLLLEVERKNGGTHANGDGAVLRPLDGFVVPLLTDMYQLTMAYAYWVHGKHEQHAVFDLFFRTCPFGSEFTIFAGLEEALRLLRSYRFTPAMLKTLRGMLPHADEGFWDWLATVNCTKIKVYAQPEGNVCFPRVPLLRVEGPIAVAQLLETPLLNLINFASLVTTNAARYRLAVGDKGTLFEFGLRRAQGPDGAMSASRYSIMGGFDSTSNVLAGALFGVTPSGTMAHSFVTSFSEADRPKLSQRKLAKRKPEGEAKEDLAFLELVDQCRKELGFEHSNDGELLSFTAYALAYPEGHLCLIDTYDTINSGAQNFLSTALALHRCGYHAKGVRLDSGDMAWLSKECRALFQKTGERFGIDYFKDFTIVASSDLSEKAILSLRHHGHEIDVFGVGTDIATCKTQPALGGVYKLVELEGEPRMKLSEDLAKVSLPGRKDVYRLYDRSGTPIFDVMTLAPSEAHPSPEIPAVGKRILCRDLFQETKRAWVTPSKVDPLLQLVWDGSTQEGIQIALPSLKEIKERVQAQLKITREDHIRHDQPTPYKVSATSELYDSIHKMWLKTAPVKEMA